MKAGKATIPSHAWRAARSPLKVFVAAVKSMLLT
jgi:hypothetical protein